MKKKRKGITGGIHRCPYCGSPVTYRSADGIYKDNSRRTMLYVCSHYPECDAYVRVHTGTNIPVGTMADRKLRKLRNEAHKHFSKLIRDDYMTKQEAYQWLAGLLGAPQREAHIGYLSEYYCNMEVLPYVGAEIVDHVVADINFAVARFKRNGLFTAGGKRNGSAVGLFRKKNHGFKADLAGNRCERTGSRRGFAALGFALDADKVIAAFGFGFSELPIAGDIPHGRRVACAFGDEVFA